MIHQKNDQVSNRLATAHDFTKLFAVSKFEQPAGNEADLLRSKYKIAVAANAPENALIGDQEQLPCASKETVCS